MPRSTVFEEAIEAVITGDLATLRQLLEQDPGLATARSEKEHHATLLHYVAANGVEDERQKTPPNAVAIAQALIDAGAEVDVLSDIYGGGPGSTPLVALVSSYPPAAAEVQGDLVTLFCKAGASPNGITNEGMPLSTAITFGYPEATAALHRCGARIDNLVQAAGLGKLDLVQRFLEEQDARPLTYTDPFDNVITDPDEVMGEAFIYACMHGHIEVADFLRQAGIPLDTKGPRGMTALHRAAWYGPVEMVTYLLNHNAPLEIKNDYNGTVLDATVWLAHNAPVRGVNYADMVERLLGAGASLEPVSPFPSGNDAVDAVLSRYGKVA